MHLPGNGLIYESFVDPDSDLINLSQALVFIVDNDVKTTHGDMTENLIDFSIPEELMEVFFILEPTCVSSSTSSSKSYPTLALRKSSLQFQGTFRCWCQK